MFKNIGLVIVFYYYVFYNVKRAYENSITFGVYKSEGYNNKQLHIITTIKNMLITAISTVIAYILYLISKIGIEQMIKYEMSKPVRTFGEIIDIFEYVNINIDNKIIFYYAIIVLSVVFITFITNLLILKRSTKELLTEKNKTISTKKIQIRKNTISNSFYVIVLFLLILTLNNVSVYLKEYYRNLIEGISNDYYELWLNSEISMPDFPTKDYSKILFIEGYDTGTTIEEFNDLKNLPYVQELYIYTYKSLYGYEFEQYYLVIDTWEHATVVEQLASLEDYSVRTYVSELDEYIVIYNVVTVMLYISITIMTVIIISLFILYINKLIDEEKENIGILRVVGYTSTRIWIKIIKQILTIIIIAYAFSLILSIGLNVLIDNVLIQYNFEDFAKIVSDNYNINTLAIFIITSITTSIYIIHKIKKMEVINILK